MTDPNLGPLLLDLMEQGMSASAAIDKAVSGRAHIDYRQLTAVDRHTSFEVVYHLQSLDLNHQVVVKALVRDHEAPSLPSAYPVYKGALLQEREVYDLMGIRFAGHPDLRRLLLWEGYPGHPLRKDFLQLEGLHAGLPHFPFETAGKQER